MCSEEERLIDAYAHAVHAYSDLIESFKEARYVEGFQKVLRAAQAARQTSEAARQSLENHVQEHGCGQDQRAN
ncbi:MAG: hypothetical protein JWN34_1237 [Bryobacterales bacterium]|nr:hypothetical protein [Bryobacterales bacterium]